MSPAIPFSVLGVGLVGPGLPSWAEALAVLRGDTAFVFAPSLVPPPQRLPPAERRRAGAASPGSCASAAISPAPKLSSCAQTLVEAWRLPTAMCQ